MVQVPQLPARRSCWTALWTAPKAAVNNNTFFMFLPSSSPANRLVSFLSASLRASSWVLTSPTSCSSLISMTPSRSDNRSVSVSSSSSLLEPGSMLTSASPPTNKVRDLETLNDLLDLSPAGKCLRQSLSWWWRLSQDCYWISI